MFFYCRILSQWALVSLTVWTLVTTPRPLWSAWVWWRWSPSLGCSARPVLFLLPHFWRAAASPTSSPPATEDATAKSEKRSLEQGKYVWPGLNITFFLSVFLCSVKYFSLLSVYWGAWEGTAERPEASRSSNRSRSSSDPQTQKPGGKVTIFEFFTVSAG